jgi:hypothetical protein
VSAHFRKRRAAGVAAAACGHSCGGSRAARCFPRSPETMHPRWRAARHRRSGPSRKAAAARPSKEEKGAQVPRAHATHPLTHAPGARASKARDGGRGVLTWPRCAALAGRACSTLSRLRGAASLISRPREPRMLPMHACCAAQVAAALQERCKQLL